MMLCCVVIAAGLILGCGAGPLQHDDPAGEPAPPAAADPLAVLVSVEGTALDGAALDAPSRAVLADALAAELALLGVDVVTAAEAIDPEADGPAGETQPSGGADAPANACPPDCAELAKELERGTLLRVRAQPAPAIPSHDGTREIGVRLEIDLVDASDPSHVTQRRNAALHLHTEAPTLEEALATHADALARIARGTLAAGLLRHWPDVAQDAAPEPLLETARTWARAHDARRERVAELHDRALRDEASSLDFTAASDLLAETYFVGPVDGGELRLIARHHLVVPDAAGTPSLRSETEALWIVPDEGEPRLLAETPEFAVFPVLSADGSSVAVVTRQETPEGTRNELAHIDVASGEVTPLVSVEEDVELRPSPTPDGTRILYRRSHDDDRVSLWAVLADGTGDRMLLGERGFISDIEWRASDGLGYVSIGNENARTIHEIGLREEHAGHADILPVLGPLAKMPDTVPNDPRTTSRFEYALPLPDASVIVVSEETADGGHWIGRFDLDSHQYRRLVEHRIAGRAELSPDDTALAVDIRAHDWAGDIATSDLEIAHIDTTTGDVTHVTLNMVDDRLAGFDANGALLVRRAVVDPDGPVWLSWLFRVEVE